MNSDNIKRIEIDEDGKLHLVTEEEKFTLIYRTATEVHWDPAKHSLYSPKPRDWSYLQWFDQIRNVAEKECYCKLYLTEKTEWLNVPSDLKNDIISRT